MQPYVYVQRETDNGESLLSLCCGIGLELASLRTTDITAVDLYQPYLDVINKYYGHVKTVCENAAEYVSNQPSRSVDVISLIDAIEHMTKKDGLKCLKNSKRVAKKSVLVFTPEGFVKNTPHDAWNISGGDEFQEHISGWEIKELESLGFELISRVAGITQHDEPYHALMMIYYV